MSDAQTLFETGLAAQQRGELAQAIAAYRALLLLAPDEIAALINGATAWLAARQPHRAMPWLERAVRLGPHRAIAHRLRAEAAQALQDESAALRGFRLAMALQPDSLETLNNYANLLAVKNSPQALTLFRRLLRQNPAAPCFANYSAALLTAELPLDALLAARTALCLAPGSTQNLNNLANAALEQRDYPRALDGFARARRIEPSSALAWINEGGLRLDLAEFSAGEALCRVALLLQPDDPMAYNNLANGAYLAGKLTLAGSLFRRALLIAPFDAQTHFNHAAVLLKQGRWQEGWREYEWRRRTPAALRRRAGFAPPDWPGGALSGLTLLLSVEQGYGDAIQFSRFAPWLAERGARILLRTDAPLVGLMRRLAGVAEVIGLEETIPPFDFHLPLMSIPHFFDLAPAAIPNAPYLSAEPSAVGRWRDRLARLPGRKIGLVWAGDPRPSQRAAHLMDRRRSIALARLAPLAELPDETLISLQKGEAAAQRALPAAPPLIDWTAELTDFHETAALVTALDLVITIDSAVAHLAGALGCPVWILSRFDGCWRWLDQGEHSIWYPSVALFRQPELGDWESVVARIVARLAAGHP